MADRADLRADRTPGVTYALASGEIADDSEAASVADGLLLRGGLGFPFRTSESSEVAPEVTMMKSIDGTRTSWSPRGGDPP
ncbi:hypothetical protein [Sorangium sp. So ce1153]|uniref:hypothetical protein n=1 Tax=Sorangium sp. So ce1153 TaxID=3133333 RepID=UPI003F63FAEA